MNKAEKNNLNRYLHIVDMTELAAGHRMIIEAPR
ncbi:Uncharacterised protein [uncultured archaeon]|nr:Uncharacterised protein [uncultured archaeon]